jgi:glucuronate isomerase
MQVMSDKTSRKLLNSSGADNTVALELYESIKDYPIISPHGHVEPSLILENKPFSNPAELFIYHDHYITRLLHANGFSLSQLGKGEGKSDPRETWKILAANWHLFAGTAVGYWMEHQLTTIFGVSKELSAESADEIYDLINEKLGDEELLPRNLLKKFKIQFLATTDDPIDSLENHRALAEISELDCKIVPTFRPDKYLDPRADSWLANVEKLCAAAGSTDVSYDSYINALANRRRLFIEHGAVSADHGVYEAFTIELDHDQAKQYFDAALAGTITAAQAREFAGHMLMEMARMSTEDGLVMTVHAGVLRNHSTDTFRSFGADTGHDIPVRAEFTENLRPLLQKYGLNPRLHLILFCLDETAVIREIAPLASFYPSVFIGAPWWFFDSPSGVMRFRESVTDIAGFYRGSGFIDDTRAFLSIPARHDMARRVDCDYLAKLVNSGRISRSVAEKIAVDLVESIPAMAFKL